MPQYEKEIGGKKLIIETGKFAFQANAAVTVRYGDTVVLATVVMSREPREDIDYFPLMVDYEEKLYAAGKIKGSRFVKREGKPTDEAILTSRCIDRSLRPLFPKNMLNDVQVIINVLSYDEENNPDIPALIASSCVLSISDIPFEGPLAAVRVARTGGELVLNPTKDVLEKSDLDLIVASKKDDIVMIESLAKEVSEDVIIDALKFGQKHSREIIDLIEEVVKKEGKEKIKPTCKEIKLELKEDVKKLAQDRIQEILFPEKPLKGKFHLQGKQIEKFKDDIVQKLASKHQEARDQKDIKDVIDELIKLEVRKSILEKERRLGNRKLDEIRPLEIEAGVLPRTHGSGLFKRGDTQVLTTVTLGAPSLEQILEDLEEERKKRFFHHYNFHPFSVGEVAPLRGPGRREIGHGALAEKALFNLLPNKEEFPYTIRLVSEVLSSNGSTSMASVCGSSLALMDAGVPIKKAAAGIAMGLMTDGKGAYKILTDIQDLEDFGGDMDFKVAGTQDGICALQMDIKLKGLSPEVMDKALEQAKQARLFILKEMSKVIDKPRESLSSYAPCIECFKISTEKIREVIGPGGKVIHDIIDKCGVEIDIDDDGSVCVTSKDKKAAKKASDWIRDIAREVKVGEVFSGKVTRILSFGAMVELWPGMEGMIHVSKLAPFRVERVEDVVKMGDIVPVKVIEIDRMGRVNLAVTKEK